MSLINFPILYIPDPGKGRPLFAGQIYVGQPDLDPTVVINQKQLNVIEENGTVVPVAQPFVLSAGGVAVYNGKPVRLDVTGNYSIKILSKLGAQVYYVENVFEGEPATVEGIINDLSQAYEFSTVAAYKDFTVSFPVGKIVNLLDRDASFTVIAGTGTANTFDVITSDIVSQSIELTHYGTVNIRAYGFIADGTKGAATGTSNKLALQTLIADQSVSNVTGNGGVYYFGALGVGENLATRTTSSIDINWGGAYLIVDGDNTVINLNMEFLRLYDVRGSMRNFEFEDVGYDIATSTGRGVMPILILNNIENTCGYSFGDYTIHKGQSLLTIASQNATTARACDIVFDGYVKGVETYYGINASNNGDDIYANYSLDTYNRAAFVYGVKNCNIKLRGKTGQASSSNLFVSNSGTGFPITEDVSIKAVLDTIDGNIVIADQSSAVGTGSYKNVKVDVSIGAIGSNLTLDSPIVRFGSFDVGGAYLASSTVSMNEINVDVKTELEFTRLLNTETSSPNYGLLRLPTANGFNGFWVGNDWSIAINGNVMNVAWGNPSTLSSEVDSKYATGIPKNGQVTAIATVTANNTTDGTVSAMASYWVQGRSDSSGNFALTAVTAISERFIGGVTPIITIDANGRNIRAQIDTYTDPNGQLKLSVQRV